MNRQRKADRVLGVAMPLPSKEMLDALPKREYTPEQLARYAAKRARREAAEEKGP